MNLRNLRIQMSAYFINWANLFHAKFSTSVIPLRNYYLPVMHPNSKELWRADFGVLSVVRVQTNVLLSKGTETPHHTLRVTISKEAQWRKKYPAQRPVKFRYTRPPNWASRFGIVDVYFMTMLNEHYLRHNSSFRCSLNFNIRFNTELCAIFIKIKYYKG